MLAPHLLQGCVATATVQVPGGGSPRSAVYHRHQHDLRAGRVSEAGDDNEMKGGFCRCNDGRQARLAGPLLTAVLLAGNLAGRVRGLLQKLPPEG